MGRRIALLLLASVAYAGEPKVVFLSGAENTGLCLLDGEVRELVPASKNTFSFDVREGRVAYVCDPDGDENFELWVLDVALGKRERVRLSLPLFN